MVYIIIGIIAGIVGGLGMGGGTILILLLTMILGVTQNIAQGSNTVFFIPTAISAIFIFIKNKKIKFKLAIPICIWGLIGTFIGTNIAMRIKLGSLKKYFGIFLIIIAINQIYYLYIRYRKEKNRNNITK